MNLLHDITAYIHFWASSFADIIILPLHQSGFSTLVALLGMLFGNVLCVCVCGYGGSTWCSLLGSHIGFVLDTSNLMWHVPMTPNVNRILVIEPNCKGKIV